MPVQEIDLGKVTGPPGPPGADGSPGERGPGTNTNMLDNWYFADPINQRGKTEYTTGYAIDRWRIVGSGSISLTKSGLAKAESNYGFYHSLAEEVTLGLRGKKVTMSVLSDVGGLESTTFVFPDTQSTTQHGNANISLGSLFLQNYASGVASFAIWFNNVNATLVAAKLELGDTQTLARQDANGNWVLNDPPPNKALELAKCQRYYQRYDKAGFYGVAYLANYTTGSFARLFIPTPVTMRANPAVSISGQFDSCTSAGESIETNMTYSGSGVLSDNGISVMSVPLGDEFETAIGLFIPYDDGLIELSAEI